ncbi:Uncharacterized protein TCM_037583 [Theobroma cacao]|uniref:PGG domain-containing protein n=1 Tax=Theobroma cacao TaxID=3641 RepID=A0A061GMG1_THECC|nr:Uncharacterized protein TCM_037583 [Theobroma cacao]
MYLSLFVYVVQTVKYLLNETAVEVNAVNQNGFTALDIIANMPRDLKGMEIHESLLNAIALRSRRIPASESGITQFIEASEKPKVPVNSEAIAASGAGNNKKKHLKNDDRLNKKYDTLMVAASVIAAMAYQEGFSPPGGVWDHDSDYFHTVQSVLATYDSKLYSIFWIFNTVSFISSISTLFFLVSGLPLKQRIYVWILMATMWVTLTSMVVTYIASMLTITPDNEQTVQMVIAIAMLAWLDVIGIVFLAHTARFIYLDCPEAKKTHKEAAFIVQKREARSGSRQCLNTYIINMKFLSETKLAISNYHSFLEDALLEPNVALVLIFVSDLFCLTRMVVHFSFPTFIRDDVINYHWKLEY